MPRDIKKQREQQWEWMKARRNKWLTENGPCRHCGSWEQLSVDHIDPDSKVDHKVWSWSDSRRAAELAKCQVLCWPCHKLKSADELRIYEHGLSLYRHWGCRCDICRAANAERGRKERAKRKAKVLAYLNRNKEAT